MQFTLPFPVLVLALFSGLSLVFIMYTRYVDPLFGPFIGLTSNRNIAELFLSTSLALPLLVVVNYLASPPLLVFAGLAAMAALYFVRGRMQTQHPGKMHFARFLGYSFGWAALATAFTFVPPTVTPFKLLLALATAVVVSFIGFRRRAAPSRT